MRNRFTKLVAASSSILAVLTISSATVMAAVPIPAIDQVGRPNFTDYGYVTDPASSTNLSSPSGVAVDTTNHRLFVSDTDRNRVLMYKLNSNNKLIDRTADKVIGQPNMTTSSSTQMIRPNSLAYLPDKNILAVSDDCNRVLAYDVAAITQNEAPTGVIGQPDLTQCTAGIGPDRLYTTDGLGSLDYDETTQRLYVGDLGNNRVLVFDTSSGSSPSAIGVLGQPDMYTSDYIISQSRITGVSSLSIDPDTQRLFVATAPARVLVFDVASVTDGEPAVNILGLSDFNEQNAPEESDQTNFRSPGTVSFNQENDYLLVGDNSANRIMVFDASVITDGEPAVAVIGKPNYTDTGSPWGADSTVFPGQIDWIESLNQFWVSSPNPTVNRVTLFGLVQIPDHSLSNARINRNYNKSVKITQANGALTYQVTAGSLPPGLTLNTSTGQIIGKATVLGTYNFIVTAVDDWGSAGSVHDAGSVTITVVP